MNRATDPARVALVTGASAGIGAELARVFAHGRFDLELTARRAERLTALADEIRQLHGVQVRVMPADLARPETPAALVAALERDGVPVDALITMPGSASPAVIGTRHGSRSANVFKCS